MKARIVVLDLEFAADQTRDVLDLLGQIIAGQPITTTAPVMLPDIAQPQIIEQPTEAVVADEPPITQVAAAPAEQVVEAPGLIDWGPIFAQDAEIARLVADIQHGKSRWSLLEKSQKFKLFTAVMRRLMQDRTPTLKGFDRHRPNWMPTGGAFIKLYGQTSWARVLEILTEKHQPALNGHSHEPRRSL